MTGQMVFNAGFGPCCAIARDANSAKDALTIITLSPCMFGPAFAQALCGGFFIILPPVKQKTSYKKQR
jgi:hypothetical protein